MSKILRKDVLARIAKIRKTCRDANEYEGSDTQYLIEALEEIGNLSKDYRFVGLTFIPTFDNSGKRVRSQIDVTVTSERARSAMIIADSIHRLAFAIEGKIEVDVPLDEKEKRKS